MTQTLFHLQTIPEELEDTPKTPRKRSLERWELRKTATQDYWWRRKHCGQFFFFFVLQNQCGRGNVGFGISSRPAGWSWALFWAFWGPPRLPQWWNGAGHMLALKHLVDLWDFVYKVPSTYPAHCRCSQNWSDNSSWVEKEMATRSSILAWRIPWTEEPGELQSMESPRVGPNLATKQQFLWETQLRSLWSPKWSQVQTQPRL